MTQMFSVVAPALHLHGIFLSKPLVYLGLAYSLVRHLTAGGLVGGSLQWKNR